MAHHAAMLVHQVGHHRQADPDLVQRQLDRMFTLRPSVALAQRGKLETAGGRRLRRVHAVLQFGTPSA